MAKILIGTLLVALISYSQAVPTDSKGPSKIVGGENAEEGESPYMVSLQWDGSHYCAGSWIDDYHVSTACHCLYGWEAASGDTCAWGGTDRTTLPCELQAAKFTCHPDYNPNTLDNDYGIIRVNTSRTVVDAAAPVPVESSAISSCEPCTNDDSGIPCTAYGWGTKSSGASTLPTDLQKVTVYTVDQATCNSNYSAYGSPITEQMICAGVPGGGKDSCQGDSGGPLVIKGADGIPDCQLGITSWGVSCADARYPGVYSQPCAAKAWIEATIAKSYADWPAS